MKKRERVDVLVQQQLEVSREQAKRFVMAGQIYDNNELRYDKPGEKVASQTQFHLKGERPKYVSRGGYKLERALEVFDIDLTDKIILDIGSSTGGFTDCALQAGAKQSYALDVGYNQLAYSLRQDERVTVMERTNFRHSLPADFTKGLPEVATIDVSFISLSLILPPLKDILIPNGDVIALIKPQFEAGPDRVGKGGVIRDKQVHEEVVTEVLEMIQSLGYQIVELTYSPITGGEGNIEFLVHLKNSRLTTLETSLDIDIVKLVEEAHQNAQ